MEKRHRKPRFRLLTADGKLYGAGTDSPSWFTLDKAREVARIQGKEGNKLTIVECDGVNVLWEVL